MALALFLEGERKSWQNWDSAALSNSARREDRAQARVDYVKQRIDSIAWRNADLIETKDKIIEVALTQRGDQDRNGVGRLGNGGDVLLADAVEGVRTEDPAIRGNADQRFGARHV